MDKKGSTQPQRSQGKYFFFAVYLDQEYGAKKKVKFYSYAFNVACFLCLQRVVWGVVFLNLSLATTYVVLLTNCA